MNKSRSANAVCIVVFAAFATMVLATAVISMSVLNFFPSGMPQ